MYTQPTHNERVVFRKTYPNLSGLLGIFIVAIEDEKTEKEGLQEYLLEEAPEYQRHAVTEGRAFLAQRELPWTIIPSCSNLYRANEAEARLWLTSVLDKIEADLVQKQKATISIHIN